MNLEEIGTLVQLDLQGTIFQLLPSSLRFFSVKKRKKNYQVNAKINTISTTISKQCRSVKQ